MSENYLIKTVSLILSLICILSLTGCMCSLNKKVKDRPGETETCADKKTEKEKPGYAIVENDFSPEVTDFMNLIGPEDYEGAVFKIATPSPALIEADAENTRGIVMDRGVKERNDIVARYFNVEITAEKADPVSMFDTLRNAVLSNDYYADLLMIPQYYICEYVPGGTLLNLSSLPYTDLDAGYFIKSGVEAACSGTSGYAAAGWASLEPDLLPAVFFNRDLAEKCGLGDPYELVKNGEWTWDRFFEFTDAAASVTADSGNVPCSWGAGSTYLSIADIVYFSEGNRLVSGGRDAGAQVVMTYDGSYHSVCDMQRLYNDPQRDRDVFGAVSSFAEGNTLFLIDRLDTMKTIRASKASWGILPMPKGSADQSGYCSLAPETSLFFAVPSNTTGVAKVSKILSALNAASYGYLIDDWLTDSMYFSLRDNESIEPAERICYGAVFDAAYSFANYSDAIPSATFFGLRNVYEGNHDVQYYLDLYSGGANSALWNIYN